MRTIDALSHHVLIFIFFLQLSKVYQTMQTSVLCDLAKFSTRQEIEKFLVDAVKNNTLQARLNHRSGTIRCVCLCVFSCVCVGVCAGASVPV